MLLSLCKPPDGLPHPPLSSTTPPPPQPKLDALDSLTLARVLASFSALSYRPPPSFMAAYASAVAAKLPLFDHK